LKSSKLSDRKPQIWKLNTYDHQIHLEKNDRKICVFHNYNNPKREEQTIKFSRRNALERKENKTNFFEFSFRFSYKIEINLFLINQINEGKKNKLSMISS